MGKIYFVFGKSSTGKDTIYKRILSDETLNLKEVVLYTTRPIRDGEIKDKTYHFINEEEYTCMKQEGRIIEEETYYTMHGPWRYFTANDACKDLDSQDYLFIGVLRSYCSIRDYFGADKVVPIYIDIDDGIRLQRALDREKKPENRKFKEMCRRFLADSEDFSEDKLEEAGINRRFINDDLERCIGEIRDFIIKDKNL